MTVPMWLVWRPGPPTQMAVLVFDELRQADQATAISVRSITDTDLRSVDGQLGTLLDRLAAAFPCPVRDVRAA